MSIGTIDEIQKLEYDVNDHLSLYDKYTNDLRLYIQACDKFTPETYQIGTRHLFNIIYDKWLKPLGFTPAEIRSDIREIQTPKTSFKESYDLRYALQNYKPGSSWLIPNFLRNVGLQLVLGATKVGKSKLVYCLIYAVTVTQKILNRPVKPGKVLFYQLEEPEETINERLFYCGFGNTDDELSSLIANFGDSVRINRSFRIDTDIDKLIKAIAEYKPALVIIDSLRKAALQCNVSENSAEMGKLVYSLQQVASYCGTCILLIHHKNKAKSSDSVTSSAGSTSIISATDGVIDLSANDKSDPELITLKTLPRNGIPITIEYKIRTDPNGFWYIDVEHEEAAASEKITGKILRFLGNNVGEYYNQFAIAKAIGHDYRDKEFKKAIYYLQNSQIIRYQHIQKTLMFCLDADSVWVVNPQDMAENIRTPALLAANALITCSTKKQLRQLVVELGLELRKKAQSLMFPSEKAKLAQYIAIWEFKIGDEVTYLGNVHKIESRIGDTSVIDNTYKLEGLDDIVYESQLEIYIPELPQEVESENSDTLDDSELSIFDDDSNDSLDDDTDLSNNELLTEEVEYDDENVDEIEDSLDTDDSFFDEVE